MDTIDRKEVLLDSTNVTLDFFCEVNKLPYTKKALLKQYIKRSKIVSAGNFLGKELYSVFDLKKVYQDTLDTTKQNKAKRQAALDEARKLRKELKSFYDDLIGILEETRIREGLTTPSPSPPSLKSLANFLRVSSQLTSKDLQP